MSTTSLRDLLQVYRVRHALSDRTVHVFLMSLDRLDEYLERPATLDDLDDTTLAKFARWRAETPHWRGRPPRPATVKKDLTSIVTLWAHAAKKRMTRSNGVIIDHPDLPRGLVKVAIRPPRGYSLEDIDALLNASLACRGMVGPVPTWWLWRSMLMCAWQTGERIGGLLALRWRDVDLDAKRVTFDGSTRKGRTKTIIRSITPELARLLSQHRTGDDDLVWPWTDHRRPPSLWSGLAKICARAGVRCRGFHQIRKTSGSFVAAGGGDATDFLSHSDAKTTRAHYLIDDIVRRDDPLDLLPALPSERKAASKARPAPASQAPSPRASSGPLEAGTAVGRSIAARGLACPPRAQHDALAAAAGIESDDVPAFSSGVLAGWMAGQDQE